VGGRCGWSWSSVVATHKHWLEQNRIAVLIQTALTKHADLPDVPLIADLAKTEEQQQIVRLIFARQVMGRPFMAPPGVPPERADILRDAFMSTMKDPQFLADAEKAKLEITPVSGADIEKLVKEVYGTPKETTAKAAAMIR
jgi:tripartite-type tricarboxylate transporter receptor subunit TctC